MSDQEIILQKLSQFLTQNYFEIFGLSVSFQINKTNLNKTYRDLQTIAHPDRFTHQSDYAERLAIQATTHINTAYNTLKSDVERSIYMLNLFGINVLDANNTQVNLEFLEEQLEWREKIAEAKLEKDVDIAENILDLVNYKSKQLIENIANMIDNQANYQQAGELTRQLIFITKLANEIETLIAELEDEN